METRRRAVSRTRTIQAPLIECLEDRRLLSIASASNVSEGLDGVQTGGAIILAASSPTGEGEAVAHALAASSEDSVASGTVAAENQSPAVTSRIEDSSAAPESVRQSATSTGQEAASLSP